MRLLILAPLVLFLTGCAGALNGRQQPLDREPPKREGLAINVRVDLDKEFIRRNATTNTTMVVFEWTMTLPCLGLNWLLPNSHKEVWLVIDDQADQRHLMLARHLKWGDSDEIKANNFWFAAVDGKPYRVQLVCLGTLSNVIELGEFTPDMTKPHVLNVTLLGREKGSIKLVDK